MAKEKNLKSIVKGTISGIEAHKGEIYEIYDKTRVEIEDVKNRIKKAGEELKNRETNRAKLESEEQKLKKELAKASLKFSEEEIEKAYDRLVELEKGRVEAEASVERLMVEREQLITREHHLNTMYNQAKHYTYAIGAALTYLSQELEGIAYRIDDLEEERLMGAKVIKAQEEERRRFSRELHDGPLQELTAIMYDTAVSEKLVTRDPENAIASIQKTRRNLRRTIGDIRQVIFDIRPMALDDQGLVGAIHELCVNLTERNIIEAEFVTSGKEHKFPVHTQVAIFRIVQESLNNAAHHSGTKKAKVVMRFTESALEVMTEDKGKGFDVEAVKKAPRDIDEHFGIISMRERAELVGAKFNIVSEKGKGTKVSIIATYEK
ncbi:MAG: hypothetical protein J6M62_01730 [Selenomonadaceae bacterium]|nr:hypothetical protein [Selenomonadaceae bacterium]MBP3722313.1 hypothetical protein [Selenomonadaceae bacterium]